MARKRSVKDYAIPMDEFHPNPSTAAAFADRKANEATLNYLADDAKRIEERIKAQPDGSPELRGLFQQRQRVLELILRTREDRKEIDRLIEEAKVK